MDSGIQLWQRMRPEAGKATTLKECDSAVIDFTRPMFFCFSGITTTDTEAANGFAKIAENAIGGAVAHDHGVQLITAIYKTKSTAQNSSEWGRITLGGNKAWAKISEEAAEKYSRDVIDHVFDRADVIPDLHGKHGEARARALAQSKKAFGNVNFMTYSFGTQMICYLHDKLRGLMKDRGFQNEEISHTLKAVRAVSIGDTGIWFHQPVAAWRQNEEAMKTGAASPGPRKPWDFTSVHFVSTNDKLSNRISLIEPDMLKKQGMKTRLLQFGDEKNVLLFLSNLATHHTAFTIDRVRGKGKRTKAADSHTFRRVETRDNTGHHAKGYTGALDLSVYVSNDGGQWLMPSAFQSAIRNCVRTSLEGNREGAAAELLLASPALPVQSAADTPTRRNLKARDIHWPDVQGYGYNHRIADLIGQSAHFSEMPPIKPTAWVKLIKSLPSPFKHADAILAGQEEDISPRIA